VPLREEVAVEIASAHAGTEEVAELAHGEHLSRRLGQGRAPHTGWSDGFTHWPHRSATGVVLTLPAGEHVGGYADGAGDGAARQALSASDGEHGEPAH
jgi:hypothetical protein